MNDVFFIKTERGFYSGHRGEGAGAQVFWKPERKGSVVFRSEGEAEDRVNELNIQNAEIVGF
jgi:hypothetical protein